MSISSILPSTWLQRIIIAVLALAIIIAVVFTFVERRQERIEQQEAGIPVSFVDDEDPNQLDTDGDGVPDWEERLWNLDVNDPDTDGDGVSDAQYLENRKNIQERRALGIEDIETDLSESQMLGRSIYTALLAIEQSGGVIDDTTREQISENIKSYVADLTLHDTLYLREDLNLVENSKEASYAYRDELNQLLQEYPIEPQDIELIAQAVENTAPFRTRIARVGAKYRTLLEGLEQMEVPFVIAGRHTELLNSLGLLTAAFENFNQDEVDDFVSLSVVIQMEEVLTRTQDAIEKIGLFFSLIRDDDIFFEA
jgi:hypothetical protein